MPDQKDPLARALQRKVGVPPVDDDADPLADLELSISAEDEEPPTEDALLALLVRKVPPRPKDKE